MRAIAKLVTASNNQTDYFKKIAVAKQPSYRASNNDSEDNAPFYDECDDFGYIQFCATLEKGLKNNTAFMKKLTQKMNSGFTYDEAIQHVLEEDNYQLLVDIWKKGLDVMMPC